MPQNRRPVSPHNRTQVMERLAREIAGFRTRLDQLGRPVSPQERRAVTLASRCLVRRERDLAALLMRPVVVAGKAGGK